MRVFMKAACCAALALLVAAPVGAQGTTWNKKTFLTFSGPVQVPGVTLPAGTYTFKLADLMGNRHVVQIFDKDEKKIYTTLLAIPDQRLELMFVCAHPATPAGVSSGVPPGVPGSLVRPH